MAGKYTKTLYHKRAILSSFPFSPVRSQIGWGELNTVNRNNLYHTWRVIQCYTLGASQRGGK
jgi:hypothetical protein